MSTPVEWNAQSSQHVPGMSHSVLIFLEDGMVQHFQSKGGPMYESGTVLNVSTKHDDPRVAAVLGCGGE